MVRLRVVPRGGKEEGLVRRGGRRRGTRSGQRQWGSDPRQDPGTTASGRAVHGRHLDRGGGGLGHVGPQQPYKVLNRFKSSQSIQAHSNLFQIISNLIQSKKGFPKLKKFKIKYGFEIFKEGTTFYIGTSSDSK
jgi:hypothetical protein